MRIIYKHDIDWYLKLSEESDSIERMLDDNEIDITGWDLRKSLRLLKKSNGALLERIQSPIIYKADQGFLDGINALAKDCFSPIACIWHYLNMGKTAMDALQEERYKLKKLFYALRAAMACKWILDRQEIVPIVFTKMVDELDLEKELSSRIYELIEFKSTVGEACLHSGEEMILTFIQDSFQRAEEEYRELSGAKFDPKALDSFFIDTLGK